MAPTSQITLKLPEDEMQIRFAPDETIVFVSSSGHCNLDCSYCVISPVAKHQPSLTYEDLRFVHEQVGKAFFIFSGTGDFFAGYRKSERLLSRLLEHEDIGVALDVNGVVVHCFEQLTLGQLAKVRHVNLTFHYRQLREHKALKVWQRNALAMLGKADSADFFVNIVLSPPESGLWEEAFQWYEENLFAHHPKKLVLINDVNIPLGPQEEVVIERLHERFGPMIQSVRRGNFASVLKQFDHVSCAAGQSYFRVWNDGRIQACPNVEQLCDSGHAKERRLVRRSEPFACSDVRHCDCYHIASAGKMVYHKTLPAGDVPVSGAPATRSGFIGWLRELGRH